MASLRCKNYPHGFYLYAYWKVNGKTRCRYVGKLDTENSKIKVMHAKRGLYTLSARLASIQKQKV